MRLLVMAGVVLVCGLAMKPTLAAPARAAPLSLHLAPGADDIAIAAVRQATRRMGTPAIDKSQSFRVLKHGRQVATLVAGKGQAPGSTYMGCFVALVQDGKTTVVPTIGSGDWEAETCVSAMATGLISTGNPVVIGIVYQAASPNALVREPVVLRWNRKDQTLAAAEGLSRQAFIRGATTIAGMRRLLP